MRKPLKYFNKTVTDTVLFAISAKLKIASDFFSCFLAYFVFIYIFSVIGSECFWSEINIFRLKFKALMNVFHSVIFLSYEWIQWSTSFTLSIYLKEFISNHHFASANKIKLSEHFSIVNCTAFISINNIITMFNLIEISSLKTSSSSSLE